jgi:hypothetical protein
MDITDLTLPWVHINTLFFQYVDYSSSHMFQPSDLKFAHSPFFAVFFKLYWNNKTAYLLWRSYQKPVLQKESATDVTTHFYYTIYCHVAAC